VPKQFASWRGKPLVRHSAETLLAAGADPLVVAIPAGSEHIAQRALQDLPVNLAIGGATRQDSVRLALEAVGSAERVLIHDAARPHVPQDVLGRLLAALDTHPGAIPVLPVVDSLAVDDAGLMAGTADRQTLRRVQTPQAFRRADIVAAHASWTGAPTAGDDAQVLRAAGGAVALVAGDEALRKMTFAGDFMDQAPPVRIGTGYDVHRLVSDEDLWLCGIKLDHSFGLAGHSDADVGLHAIVDALLGAVGAGDIGAHFPPSDARWKGAASSRFVEHAAVLVAEAGYRVGNIDVTLICEAPKIGPHREAMCAAIAALAGMDPSAVSVKATTTEGLGFTGRAEGIAAQAVATVIRNT
jgi:2-C-methyl-D-erythritol 4-phosphate cytidylyltransferase/2-C-methyl-D-erythritol 2,4-cyclodiphosphate synthase